MIERLKSLPRTVWLLGLISLVNDSASDMIYPLVPLYLSSVLMAGPKALGLIEGLAESIGSILKLVAGVLADRTHKVKYWIVAGYGIAGLARPLIAFATSWTGVLMCRIADRIGKGVRTAPRDALLNLSVDPSQRGLAFGFHRAMDNMGAVVGPLLAAGLLALGMPLRYVLLSAVVPAIAVIVLSLSVREPERPVTIKPAAFSWNLSEFPPQFRRYLLVLALFMLGNSSNMFLLLRARELGLSETQVPMLGTGFVCRRDFLDATIGVVGPDRTQALDRRRLERLCGAVSDFRPAAGQRVAALADVRRIRIVPGCDRGRREGACRRPRSEGKLRDGVRLVQPDRRHPALAGFGDLRLAVGDAVAIERVCVRFRLRAGCRRASALLGLAGRVCTG